jgi:GNAT superfamily N-acetyltransferase
MHTFETMTIRSPLTPTEWDAYYRLRFTVLREPWAQPAGSEVLPDEVTAEHAAAYDADGTLLGVARLQTNSPTTAQVRCVAVAPTAQGRGVGKALMAYLEDRARQRGHAELILEARENAVPFYRAIGYTTRAESYLLFGQIQHWTMGKELIVNSG